VLSYYKKVLDGLGDYFSRNRNLFNYIRTGQTINDKIYFIRNAVKEMIIPYPESTFDIDPEFSTPHSSVLSKLMAYEKLEEHLRHLYYEHQNPDYSVSSLTNKQGGIWTDSKTALIELAYAMHARGSINNGKGDIRMIITK